MSALAVPTGFGVLGGDEHATHGEFALALAAEFGRVDLASLEAAMSDLARRLAVGRSFTPAHQLGHVGEVLADRIHVVDREPPKLEDLLFDRVVVSGHGHSLTAVLVAIEAGRRAGLDIGLVASARHMLLAVPAMHSPLVSIPDRGWRIVDARDLGDPTLSWMCPHESAAIWLAITRQAAIARGSTTTALRALDMHLELPMHGPEQRRLERLRAQIRVAPQT